MKNGWLHYVECEWIIFNPITFKFKIAMWNIILFLNRQFISDKFLCTNTQKNVIYLQKKAALFVKNNYQKRSFIRRVDPKMVVF